LQNIPGLTPGTLKTGLLLQPNWIHFGRFDMFFVHFTFLENPALFSINCESKAKKRKEKKRKEKKRKEKKRKERT
jgi:hypothetical protein